jgi:4-hydroxy-tetrahydrodipicolinate reductase
MTIRVAVAGATGRLGALVCEIVEQLDGYVLTDTLNSQSTNLDTFSADVLVDVTRIDVSERIVSAAINRGISVIIGTSGWSAERLSSLEKLVAAAPENVSALVVPNFSVGSVLGTAISAAIAPYFDAVEIVEAHHAGKIDSPSGTAVRTAERVAHARQGHSPFLAPNTDQQARGELIDGIPVHSLRLPGVVAKQDVVFSGVGETLTITHDTSSQEAYRAGIRAALLAAPSATGVTIGLDAILGIDFTSNNRAR